MSEGVAQLKTVALLDFIFFVLSVRKSLGCNDSGQVFSCFLRKVAKAKKKNTV